MLSKVTLTNFRQHTSLTVDLTAGLNVIRGRNEGGKTTILEAVSYGYFGSGALRQSLAETVTWGMKESSLRVETVSVINGQTFRTVRGNSGAEVYEGVELKVTGQREVTKFWEEKLGTTAAAATKLMIASQTSLKGALSDGPTAAAELIESLANFDLIDTIATLIEGNLPNGNTSTIETQLQATEQALAEEIEDDRPEALAALAKAEAALAEKNAEVERRKLPVEELLPDWLASEQAITAKALAEDTQFKARNRAAQAKRTLEAIQVPEQPDMAQVPVLQQAVKDGAAWASNAKLLADLKALPTDMEWDEGRDALQAEISKTQVALETLLDEKNTKQLEKTTLTGQLITETHCALCDKDLTDVPEVAARNSKLAPNIRELADRLAKLPPLISYLKSTLADLNTVNQRAVKAATVYQRAASHITLDEAFVPARWTWIGPDLSKQPDAKAADKLKALQAAKTAADTTSGRHQEASQALQKAQAEAEVADTAFGATLRACSALDAPRQAYLEVLETCRLAQADLKPLEKAVEQAKNTLVTAERVHVERLRNRAAVEKTRTNLQATLKQVGKTNALLKKVRGARPQVANKLWAIVLTAVSKYFTDIRGVDSVITRETKSFQCNGKPVASLSGSAQDALGLAIRIALTKTFLPNTRFMVLDEPASACSDEREISMLGVIAASDFDQVILVTHSDLADVFSAQVIQL